MTQALPIERVEVKFVGVPPAQRIKRASGVSDVEIDGPVPRCVVSGSFQPLLDTILGHEVVTRSRQRGAGGIEDD